MAYTTFSDRIAAARRILKWIREHRAEVREMHLDPDFMLGNLTPLVDACETGDVAQEALKAQLVTQTKALEAWDRQMYEMFSSYIDLLSGAYGKNSPQSKQLRRFRSKLHWPTKRAPRTVG